MLLFLTYTCAGQVGHIEEPDKSIVVGRLVPDAVVPDVLVLFLWLLR